MPSVFSNSQEAQYLMQDYDFDSPKRNSSHSAQIMKEWSPNSKKEKKSYKNNSWIGHMSYLTIYDIDYAFRARTEAIFKNKEVYVFDFFNVDDHKFEQFYLYQNLWRETLLLNHFYDPKDQFPKVARVKDFGQLPKKVIYREIEEVQGVTLYDYIQNLNAQK